MKKQMDFSFAKWLKMAKNHNITILLHLHYGSVKYIDFFTIKYKI